MFARFIIAILAAAVIFMVGGSVIVSAFGESAIVVVFIAAAIVFLTILFRRSDDSSPTVRYEYHEKHSTSGGVPKSIQFLAAIAGIVAAIAAVMQLAQ